MRRRRRLRIGFRASSRKGMATTTGVLLTTAGDCHVTVPLGTGPSTPPATTATPHADPPRTTVVPAAMHACVGVAGTAEPVAAVETVVRRTEHGAKRIVGLLRVR